ncbi:hypothetical protein AYL99_02621 [Fonsecaea erecta]|uniref:BTB domain-containing protein n=1 Tax=Fonsecaea erecta TaxID=1367422 RepID=A0A178ZUE6_9EURO|nr:hypothetical protein AYL99_02621 [Fonsecaea erecta]OAP63394.1 hypothetical protein AYL99_02621 [Fonsecaea erecta]
MSNWRGERALTAEELARRYNKEARAWTPDDSSQGNGARETLPRRRITPQSLFPRKRQRTSATVPVAGASPLASANVSPAPSEAPVRVKTEAEVQALEHLRSMPPEKRVKVYVGEKSTAMEVGLEDLDKSPVLKSFISESGAPGPYIMHPTLVTVNVDHFQSIREFLLMDEYMPALVNNPRGEDVLPKQLDNCTTPDHYRHQALRAGHVYVIAETLRMPTLQDLIFRKITQAQFHPYGVKCLLDLALIIFSRPELDGLKQKGKVTQAEDENENEEGDDALENWLINSLKDEFQRTMVHHAQQFFHVSAHSACRRREFGRRVLRRTVEDWDALRPDVVAIEIDG